MLSALVKRARRGSIAHECCRLVIRSGSSRCLLQDFLPHARKLVANGAYVMLADFADT